MSVALEHAAGSAASASVLWSTGGLAASAAVFLIMNTVLVITL